MACQIAGRRHALAVLRLKLQNTERPAVAAGDLDAGLIGPDDRSGSGLDGAAHSGTVIISGWNNSYGNQVLLDNGAGLSTRYAHMTAAAVSAGETVTAGQVIGYVGNTGDSTGFHLHFEVMQNGVRVNPLDAVTPQ